MTCVATDTTSASPDCYRYLDWCPTAIGITPRAVELLEKYEGITTVRGLLCTTPQKLLSIPQFSRGTLGTVFQCLANVGFNVPGYVPQREHNAEEVSNDDSVSLGLAKTRSMRLFSVATSSTPKPVLHPKIKPNTTDTLLSTPKTVRNKRMPRPSKASQAKIATEESPTSPTDVRFTLGVSQELANQGVFVTRYHTPIPLPLASTCFVVLLDLNESKIVSSFMAYRPSGVTQDVLVYDASARTRVVSTQIDHIGGLPVYVDVAATFEDIAPYCLVNLEKTLLDIRTDLKQSIEALAADDLKAPHVERAAMFPTGDRSPVAAAVAEVVGEESDSSPFDTEEDEDGDETEDGMTLEDDEEGSEDEEFEDDEESDEDEEFEDDESDDLEGEDSDDDEELEDDDEEFEDDETEDSEEFEQDDSDDDDDEEFEDEDLEDDEEFEDDESDDEDDSDDDLDEDLEDDDDEEEELDLKSMDVKQLMKALAPMSLDQLRSRAAIIGVSKVKCERVKTAEAMRQAIINQVTMGQRK